MSYNLFLDDIRIPWKSMEYMHPDMQDLYCTLEWIVVKDYYQFIQTVEEKGLPKLVSFDHDLADEHLNIAGAGYTSWDEYYKAEEEQREMTGYDCVKWLCNYCQENSKRFPEYILHTMNDVGLHNMKTYIENYKKHCE